MSNTPITKLEIGSIVVLRLDGGTAAEHTQQAVFLGLNDDKDSAQFVTAADAVMTRWYAYRYKGRWSYGSSAGRIAVDSVVSKF